jgi:hypothetical protein
VVRDDQPDAREGQAGRRGDAEGFVVLVKPGNAGGGKGPEYLGATWSHRYGRAVSSVCIVTTAAASIFVSVQDARFDCRVGSSC